MSKSLLDLMPEKEAKKAIERGKRRMDHHKSIRGADIYPEIFLVSEMGYYFGWDAVMAIRRGYTVEPVSGVKEPFSLEEAQVLLEGARKVWYSKLTEQTYGNVIGNSFRSESKTIDSAVKQFTDKARVVE